MTIQNLQNKKITLATLKSFIKKSPVLFVEHLSAFSGNDDYVISNENPEMRLVSKENAIGFQGVYCVGYSRDYFKYVETTTHYGIKVYNCCGSAILWTPKN